MAPNPIADPIPNAFPPVIPGFIGTRPPTTSAAATMRCCPPCRTMSSSSDFSIRRPLTRSPLARSRRYVGAHLKIGQQNVHGLFAGDRAHFLVGYRLGRDGRLDQQNAGKSTRDCVSDAHNVLHT